jgi:protein-S-isoprenylcysteine O-methyltransferase Ste14
VQRDSKDRRPKSSFFLSFFALLIEFSGLRANFKRDTVASALFWTNSSFMMIMMIIIVVVIIIIQATEEDKDCSMQAAVIHNS